MRGLEQIVHRPKLIEPSTCTMQNQTDFFLPRAIIIKWRANLQIERVMLKLSAQSRSHQSELNNPKSEQRNFSSADCANPQNVSNVKFTGVT